MMIVKIVQQNKFSRPKKALSLVKYIFYYALSTWLFNKRYRDNARKGLAIKSISRAQKKEYKRYWEGFGNKVEIQTVNTCYTISGKYDKKIIPENIFFCNIELTLNRSSSIAFLQNKSIYNKWYSRGIFPRDYLHCLDGSFYDSSLLQITEEKIPFILSNIKYPVVIKPNIDSAGGENVYFAEDEFELKARIGQLRNFVVQEKLVQSEKLNYIYEGINTVRVCVYKSVTDNKFYVLNAALRVGRDGLLDNESGGGLVCFVNDSGKLNDTAVNKHGQVFYTHPNTGREFGFQLPYYDQLCKTAVEVSEEVLYARLISLDMCLDANEKWRVIEVNLLGHTIRFAQYAGQPFFGRFTDEVVEYCLKNHWAFEDQKLFS